MTWFRSHIIDNFLFVWLLLYFPFIQDSAYDWSCAFVLIENDSLFKGRVSSLWVWLRLVSIGVSVSADLFLRGFLQSFSRFFHLPLPLMKIFPSIFEEKRMSGWIWVQIVAIAVKTVSHSRLEADMDGSTTQKEEKLIAHKGSVNTIFNTSIFYFLSWDGIERFFQCILSF